MIESWRRNSIVAFSLCAKAKDVVLKAYLDDSSDSEKKVVWSLAAYILQDFDWPAFEDAWRFVLSRHGVAGSPFHMVDLAHRKGEYAKWLGKEHDDEVADFLSDLVQVIVWRGPYPVVSSVYVQPFNSLGFAKPFGDAYNFALVNCIEQAVRRYPDDPIVFVIDPFDYPYKRLDIAFNICKQMQLDVSRVTGSPVPKNVPQPASLGPADFLAYEARKIVEDSEPDPYNRRSRSQKHLDGVTFPIELAPGVSVYLDITPNEALRKSLVALSRTSSNQGTRWDGEMLESWRQRYPHVFA
jgi:hypothetical protein